MKAAPKPAPRAPRLPGRSRFAAILLMLISAGVGIYAADEVLLLSHPEAVAKADTVAVGGLDPASVHKFNQVLFGSLHAMADSRAFVLSALAIASALAFVAAGRLLRPAGVSRESVRRLLAGSALTAAVLRTIDGAQMAVAYHRAVGAVADGFLKVATQPGMTPPVGMKEWLAPASAAGVLIWTQILVGVFLFTAQHFRSKPVREFIAASDALTSQR